MTCATQLGSLSFINVLPEETLGALPSPVVRHFIPATALGVNFVPQTRATDAFTGSVSPSHTVVTKGNPKGTLTFPLYGWQLSGQTKSLAQVILEWAIPADGYNVDTVCDLPSVRIEQAEGPGNSDRYFSGMRVGQLQIAASETDPQVKATLTLEGLDTDEISGGVTAPPDDMERLLDFDFSDVVLTIGGTETSIKGFNLNIDHKLQVTFNNARRPEAINVGSFEGKLTLDRDKTDDAWDILLHDDATHEYSIVLEMRGSHNGTGGVGTEETVCTITLARCVLMTGSTAIQRGQNNSQNLEFNILKPQSTDKEIEITFTEE